MTWVPTTWTSRSSTAGSTTPTGWPTRRPCRCSHDEAYEGSRHRYVGEVKLDRPGPFGYTARIVPRHRLTTGPGELGLATLPAESAGMDSGVLR